MIPSVTPPTKWRCGTCCTDGEHAGTAGGGVWNSTVPGISRQSHTCAGSSANGLAGARGSSFRQLCPASHTGHGHGHRYTDAQTHTHTQYHSWVEFKPVHQIRSKRWINALGKRFQTRGRWNRRSSHQMPSPALACLLGFHTPC